MSARYPEENRDVGVQAGSWCQHMMRGKEVQPACAAAAAVLPAGLRQRGGEPPPSPSSIGEPPLRTLCSPGSPSRTPARRACPTRTWSRPAPACGRPTAAIGAKHNVVEKAIMRVEHERWPAPACGRPTASIGAMGAQVHKAQGDGQTPFSSSRRPPTAAFGAQTNAMH